MADPTSPTTAVLDAAARAQNLGDLIPIMRQLCETITVGEFLAGAETHDVPASKINTIHELPTDAQVMHNEVFVERDHPAAGQLREPRPAPRFSATPASVGHRATLR